MRATRVARVFSRGCCARGRSILGSGRMSSKPIVAIVQPPAISHQMYGPDELQRLAERALIVGPVTEKPAVRDALAEATVALTGWGSPKFDEPAVLAAPKLRLIAYSAGSLKHVI